MFEAVSRSFHEFFTSSKALISGFHIQSNGLYQCMKITISRFPGKVKKTTQESNMLIDISRWESVISPLLLLVVLSVYQIYQFLKLVYDLFKPEFRM